MKKYRITLNEKQMQVLKDVCELRFRIDLCQDYELSEILATMNDLDLSPENPNHKTIFDSYIGACATTATTDNFITFIPHSSYAYFSISAIAERTWF